MVARDYPGNGIVVHWDSRVCMHSARCFGALPQVFRPSEKPWVQLDGAAADAVVAAIELCPSGALRYTRTQTHPEETPAMTADPGTDAPVTPAVKLTVYADGPNVLVGPIEIRNGAGELVKIVERVSLCRCGNSQTKPFCDGSHKRVGFSDPGPVAAAETPAEPAQ